MTSNEEEAGSSQAARKARDEALLQSAMQRVRKAQEKGKKEVKLSKEELAAWQRRQKQEEEARRAKKTSGSGSDRRRRKEKEQRFAVPLSRLEPVSRKKRSPTEDALPKHPSPTALTDSQERAGYPPMGYFPPPSGSRSRPRSGTNSRPPSRAQDRQPSPFVYEYAQPSASSRRVSDMGYARPRSSFDAQAYEDQRGPAISPTSSSSSTPSSRHPVDPFQYQTAGPRAPPPAGAAAAQRRPVSGPADMQYMAYRRDAAAPAAARGSQTYRVQNGDDETTEESTEEDSEEDSDDDDDDESSSDELNQGARIRETTTRVRGAEVVVQEPAPRPSKSKRSQVKRKAVGSGSTKRKK